MSPTASARSPADRAGQGDPAGISAGTSRHNRPLGLLAALFAAVFAGSAGTHALTPLFPELKALLAVGDAEVRQLTAAYTLGYSLAGFVLGIVCDVIGRRRVLLLALPAYALFSALPVLAGAQLTFAQFLAARALAGLATGGIAAGAIALTSDLVEYRHRGRAMALVLGASHVAVVAGIPLASLLARRRLLLVFLVLAAVALLAALWLALHLPRGGGGRALSREALALPRRALAARGATAAILSTLLGTLATFLVVTSLADHGVDRFQAGLAQRAVLFLWVGLGAVAGALLTALGADRLGKARSVALSLLATALLGPLLLLPDSLPGFTAVAAALAVAQAARQGPFAALLTGLAGSGLRGSLVGWNSLCSGIGLALGSWLGGVLYGAAALRGCVLAAAAALLLALLLFQTRVAPAERATS